MNELNWTGERLVTSVKDIHGTIEHLHRYALALQLANNKIVLDIASGEGYGSNLLSKVAKKVIGVDICEQSIAHAKAKYVYGNLEFLVGSTSNIPLSDKSVDVVISFETIEHHDEHELMMQEIKRVLVPNGILLISSPEKSIYKDRDSNNKFHIKELTLKEFKSLLNTHFKQVKIFDQRFVFGSIVNEIGHSNGFSFFDGNFSSIKEGLEEDDKFYNRPFFNIALASDELVENQIPGTSFFNGLNVLQNEISTYKNELSQIRNSYSYRVGAKIIKPFALIKNRKKR